MRLAAHLLVIAFVLVPFISAGDEVNAEILSLEAADGAELELIQTQVSQNESPAELSGGAGPELGDSGKSLGQSRLYSTCWFAIRTADDKVKRARLAAMLAKKEEQLVQKEAARSVAPSKKKVKKTAKKKAKKSGSKVADIKIPKAEVQKVIAQRKQKVLGNYAKRTLEKLSSDTQNPMAPSKVGVGAKMVSTSVHLKAQTSAVAKTMSKAAKMMSKEKAKTPPESKPCSCHRTQTSVAFALLGEERCDCQNAFDLGESAEKFTGFSKDSLASIKTGTVQVGSYTVVVGPVPWGTYARNARNAEGPLPSEESTLGEVQHGGNPNALKDSVEEGSKAEEEASETDDEAAMQAAAADCKSQISKQKKLAKPPVDKTEEQIDRKYQFFKKRDNLNEIKAQQDVAKEKETKKRAHRTKLEKAQQLKKAEVKQKGAVALEAKKKLQMKALLDKQKRAIIAGELNLKSKLRAARQRLKSEQKAVSELDVKKRAHDASKNAQRRAAKAKAARMQHRPLKCKAGGKCVVAAGATVKMGSCSKSAWFMNPQTQTIENKSNMCITHDKSKVSLKKCTGKANQMWVKMCGAIVTKSAGLYVMTGGAKFILEKWYGEKQQTWHYSSVVKHGNCGNKKFKTFLFDGTLNPGIKLANFLSIPTADMTYGVWFKGAQGTLWSYASKHHVRAFVAMKPSYLQIYVMDQKINTRLSVGDDETWQHLAVTWDSKSGALVVYHNGVQKFRKTGVQTGKKITAGGCLMLGHVALKACKSRVATEAFAGEMSDFFVWRGILNQGQVDAISRNAVSATVMKGVGKLTGKRPPVNMRIAWLSRQYAKEELGKAFPPTCKLKKNKRLPKAKGYMKFHGSGDVHYSTFSKCKYDDQSVGEWAAVELEPETFKKYPLRVQYRTSPNRQSCSWCQNGAVSYIDGCAVSFKEEKASAGFGGFKFPGSAYTPYAGKDGAPLPNNKWVKGTNMRVKALTTGSKAYGAAHGNFQAILMDGTKVACSKGAIDISVPKFLAGLTGGLAGSGDKATEFKCGPNPKGGCAGKVPAALKKCMPSYQYTIPASPFNGNSPSKPICKFFKSWQVDGKTIPSAFNYCCGRNAGSFNRVAGAKVKPIKGVLRKRPAGSKNKAHDLCKPLRKNPKARAKCMFDVMVLGAKAVKKTIRDRMQQRKAKTTKPGILSVRDLSKYRNDGHWLGATHWGCAEPFQKVQHAGPSRACTKGERCKKKKQYAFHAEKKAKIVAHEKVLAKEPATKVPAKLRHERKVDALKAEGVKEARKRELEKNFKYAQREVLVKLDKKAKADLNVALLRQKGETVAKNKEKIKTESYKADAIRAFKAADAAWQQSLEKRRKTDAKLPSCKASAMLPKAVRKAVPDFGNKPAGSKWAAVKRIAPNPNDPCQSTGVSTKSDCDRGLVTVCQHGEARRYFCGCKQAFTGEFIKSTKIQASKHANARCSADKPNVVLDSAHATAKATEWTQVCKQKHMWNALGITESINNRCPSAAKKADAKDLKLETVPALQTMAQVAGSKQNCGMNKACLIAAVLKEQTSDKKKIFPAKDLNSLSTSRLKTVARAKGIKVSSLIKKGSGGRGGGGIRAAIERAIVQKQPAAPPGSGIGGPGSAEWTALEESASNREISDSIKQMKAQMVRNAKKNKFRFLEAPKVTMPDNSCGSVFVSGVSVCNTGPFIATSCPIKGTNTLVKVGCGCFGDLIRGEQYGLLTDKGTNPDCVTKFNSKEAPLRQKRCEQAGFGTCGLDTYNKCISLLAAETNNAIEVQSVMAQSVHDTVVDTRTKFKIAMNDFSKKLKRTQDEVVKLHERISNAKDRWTKWYRFKKVPMVKFPGTVLEDDHDVGSCTSFCGQNPACKSFTFDSTKRECSWSTDGFRYSDDWTLHIKPEHVASSMKFYAIPGMKYDNADMTTKVNKSPIECKVACHFDASCRMYSSSQVPGADKCILTGRTLSYQDNTDYYEKEAIPGAGANDKAAAARNVPEKRHKKMMKTASTIRAQTKTANARINMFNQRFNANERKEKHNRDKILGLHKAPNAVTRNGKVVKSVLPKGDATVCNWKCYLDRYADLKKAFGNNLNKAEAHWAKHGKGEKRDCTCPKGMRKANKMGNVARGKPTKQSSVSLGGVPERAVDGNSANRYSMKSCTQTKAQDNPWWRVNLKTSQSIGSVQIMNRGDCCGSRLNGVEVRVGVEDKWNSNKNSKCGCTPKPAQGQISEIDCKGKKGNYVFLVIPGKKKILTVCEVIIKTG